MSILNTRTQILHIDTINNEYTCVYDKIHESPLDYLLDMPLSNATKDICETLNGTHSVYMNEDGSIGVYKLAKDKGYLIQIFSETTDKN